ncbi:MAG: serine protease [Methylococcales bacterium]|nr:serine protease [Methylococcales bacterium]MBT7443180.1 serine protease [Methylococcales bacterium]
MRYLLVLLLCCSSLSVNAFSKQAITPLIDRVDDNVMCIKSEMVVRGKKQLLTGTGVQIRPGLVATVHHQVKGVKRVVVYTRGGQASEAKVIAVDVANDLALLQIAPRPGGISVLPITPRIGEEVFSIGCPFGMDHSLSRGYVKKPLTDWGGREYVELDMSVNTGDSGGPVFNLRGEWVGIVGGYLKEAKSISFAMPITKLLVLLERNGLSNTPGFAAPGPVATRAKPGVTIQQLWAASQKTTGAEQQDLLQRIVRTTARGNRDMYLQGLAYYAMGELDRAGIFIQEYLPSADDDHIAHVILAEIYIHQGKFVKAQDFLLKAATISPEYATTYLYLGEVYDRGLNNVATATEYYQRFLKLAPKSSESFRIKRWLTNHPLTTSNE